MTVNETDRHDEPTATNGTDNTAAHDVPTQDSDGPTDTTVEQRLENAVRNDNCDELKKILDSRIDLIELPIKYEFSEGGSNKTLDVAPLALAAALNKLSIVEILLEYNANVSAEIPIIGGTALHLAARFGSKEIASLLISKNADIINQRDQSESAPLHLASRYNKSGIIACLLDAHADLSLQNDVGTPFHVASAYGHQESLELLWERGSPDQIKEKNKYTNEPLHLACIYGRIDVTKWLIKTGATVDQVGMDGCTPLHRVAIAGHTDLIGVLLDHGADIHKRNKFWKTPLLLASLNARPRTLKALIKRAAMVSDVDKEHNSAFHQPMLSKKEFSGQHRLTFEYLIGAGVDINQPNDFGRSPLYLACVTGQFKHAECLLDFGADINQKGALDGVTPLMETACKQDSQAVRTLLQRGADMTMRNHHGLTALALASVNGRLENIRALINNGAKVRVHDRIGHTPLYSAAVNKHTEVALELLATSDYYPQNPAIERPFTDDPADVPKIQEFLLNILKEIPDDLRERLPIIMHWAVSNGAIDLARLCISIDPKVQQWKRSGATWLHVAAQHGRHELLPPLSHTADAATMAQETAPLHEIDVSAVAKGNITAMHVAAVTGSVKTVQCFLQMIPEQSRMVSEIIRENNQGQSPLAISIHRRHKELETEFLAVIRRFGSINRRFAQTNPTEANRILETLAKYETPGQEVVLKELLQQWFPCEHETQQEFTTLHWAVYSSQATVVWWLLSKGGYASGYTIESTLKLVPGPYKDTDIRYHIRRLLRHPPPILNQAINVNDGQTLPPPLLVDEGDSTLDLEGDIIDIYFDGETVNIPYRKSSIRDIIYNHGPKSLMKNAGGNWEQRDLDVLKRTIERTIHARGTKDTSSYSGSSGSIHSHPVPQSDQEDDQEDSYDIFGGLKLRWVHLPVNELHLMRDLACRLSHDSDRSRTDHADLMKHFDRSWIELPAGGNRKYMRPQCAQRETAHSNRDSSIDHFSEHRITCKALYMPYLTPGSHPSTTPNHNTQGLDELGVSTNDRNLGQIKHQPLTIDQYYYPIIADTTERDYDQVISRLLQKKYGDAGAKTILMVNQLWIWILDEKTIITATSENMQSETKPNLLETTMDSILRGGIKSIFELSTSAQSVMERILAVATGSFIEKSVSCPGGDMKGPTELFRESLRGVADDETRLFKGFLAGLQKEKKKQGLLSDGSWLNFPIEQTIRNRYHIISSETELLYETRDILDELRILKSLADDQDVVWKQAFSRDYSTDRIQYDHSCTPADVKEDLEEMLLEAEKTTNYINTLLDLRQAEYNRIQADDSARQSKSILVFTIVTIVFLPLSFLASLFALDVTVFPHEAGVDGPVYQAYWIFPIIFGVTTLVCIPAIFLAWNANAISDRLRARVPAEDSSIDTNSTVDSRSSLLAQQNIDTSELRQRWWKAEKEALPWHRTPEKS